MMTRATDGRSTHITAIALLGVSTAPSSSSPGSGRTPRARSGSCRPGPMQAHPSVFAERHLGEVRWMSMPITRHIRSPPAVGEGSGGPHEIYGSALAAQPAGSQGRPATNANSQLIEQIGLPTLHAPSAPRSPDTRTIREYRGSPPSPGRREHHAGFQLRSSASMARSNAAPRWSASSTTKPPSTGRGNHRARPSAMLSPSCCPPRPHEQERPNLPSRFPPANSYTTSRDTTWSRLALPSCTQVKAFLTFSMLMHVHIARSTSVLRQFGREVAGARGLVKPHPGRTGLLRLN
jgi:hypothetical protein